MDSHSNRISSIPSLMIIVLSTAAFSGCIGEINGPDGETRTVKDMLGRDVEIPVDVEGVVGIEAGALRMLVYMEAQEMVVGVEEIESRENVAGGAEKPYIIANPELKELQQIGPMHGGDAELILESDPDVILWTYTTAKDADDLQEKTGIPVIGLQYGDLNQGKETFYDALRLVGNVTGKEERAEYLIDYIEDTMRDLRERTEDIPSTMEAYVGGIGYKGAHGILSTEPAYTSFSLVNVDNVASGIGLEHAFIDQEQLLEWDPEHIFVDEGGYSITVDDLGDSAYGIIEAVEENRIYGVLPYNWYTINYGTVLANSYYIGAVLYPDRFSDIDPGEKADEIYTEMVGGNAYYEMSDHFGGFKKIVE